MKRAALFFILTCLAITGLLAGCKPATPVAPQTPFPGTTSSPTKASTYEPTSISPLPTGTRAPIHSSTLQVNPQDLNNITLSFWHPWSGDMRQVIDAIVNEFNQTNLWGIQVITSAAGGTGALVDTLEQKLDAGDTLPNVVMAPAEQILFWQESQGLFSDLNDYIDDPQWGLTAQERAEIPLQFWRQAAREDQQAGMPALQDMRVLFYNQSWAQELGFFAPPQDFIDFGEQVCAAAATRKDIDGTGGWIVDTSPLTDLSWILSADPPEIFDERQNAFHFASPQAGEVFSGLRELFDQGCAWNSRLPDPYQYFADRQTLIYSGGLQDIPLQSEWMQRRGHPDQWIILPYPVEAGKPVVVTSGNDYAILESTPEEQLAAWLFIRWMILPRHQASLASASGLLPVSTSALASMQDFRQAYPPWEAVQAWIPLAVSPPLSGWWSIVQPILEDASWQTYQTFTAPEDIPGVFEELDALIQEVITQHSTVH